MVKVKRNFFPPYMASPPNSNTTNVKVKHNPVTTNGLDKFRIQIQPMLRLNSVSIPTEHNNTTIQIQPMLRLNLYKST